MRHSTSQVSCRRILVTVCLTLAVIVGLPGSSASAARDGANRLALMPTPRVYFAAVAGNDGKIYTIGGMTSFPPGPAVATVEAYDPATNSWSTVASLPAARFVLVAAGSNGKIYALGGFTGQTYPDGGVDVYDPATNSWSAGAPMPTRRVFLSAATGLDGRIYAIGGINSAGENVGTMEAYDPASNSWSIEPPMPTARGDVLAAATGRDGKIYVFGGFNAYGASVTTVDVYDPATNSWTTKTPIPTTSPFHFAVGHDGKFYALGTIDYAGHLVNAVEAYDPATNRWTPKTRVHMPTLRRYSEVATGLDGKIYVIGGSNGVNDLVGNVDVYDPATNSWGAGPAPLSVSLKLTQSRLKVGQQQTVTVVTAPHVHIAVLVRFPDDSKQTKTGKADSKGHFTWSFNQPPVKSNGKNHSATVTVTVSRGTEPAKSASQQYTIN